MTRVPKPLRPRDRVRNPDPVCPSCNGPAEILLRLPRCATIGCKFYDVAVPVPYEEAIRRQIAERVRWMRERGTMP